MSNLVGLNVGLSDSLSSKTRLYADYYRQLAAGTIREVVDDETVKLSNCFYGAKIERATFTKCTRISSGGAFRSCQKLYFVDFPELAQTGSYAFYGTTNLSYVFFPKLTDVVNATFQAAGVETVDLPACALIRDSGFDSCKKLKEIKIPICKEIRTRALYNCTALEKIFLDSVTAVPTLGTNALYGTPEELKIIVPDNLVDSFKAATGWSAYADKIVGVSEYNAAT